MGRPATPIDPKAVEIAVFFGANNSEIAAQYGVTEAVIRKRFSEQIAKGKARRTKTLKKWLWKACKKGNITAMIWMSKQELGYSDKVESKNDQTIIVKEKAIDTSPKIDDRINGSTTPSAN